MNEDEDDNLTSLAEILENAKAGKYAHPQHGSILEAMDCFKCWAIQEAVRWQTLTKSIANYKPEREPNKND